MRLQSRLAMMLIESGLITQDEIDEITEILGPGETDLAESLYASGKVTEELITEFLAEIHGVDPVYLNEISVDNSLKDLIPQETAREFILLPFKEESRLVYVVMGNPSNLYAIDEIKFATGKEVVAFASAPSAVRRALDEMYGKIADLVTVEEQLDEYDEEEDDVALVESLEGDQLDEDEEAVDEYSVTSEDEPVVKFVNDIIAKAVTTEVSDIHFEPYEKYMRVRYRRDGACHEVIRLPKKIQPAILSRLKIMSRMNIAERRKTQDGRIKAKIDGRFIDFRVNAVPAINGEKVVLRILDRGNLEFDLRQLGFPEDALKRFLAGVNSPYGIVLVTGPTGSGKTTTLYSALSSLNTPSVNIHTAEDPIEYHIEGLVQTQIDFAAGYDFATALRAILRQDPNIIMVGEIRDLETASIAIKAALTGQLVFSTIHTNDAPSTVNRLVDIGIKPFLVASAVRTIMAQRLVRRICKECRAPTELDPEDLREAGIDPGEMTGITAYAGSGCTKCAGSGYRGRVGLYEVLTLDKNIKQAVIDRASAGELRLMAVKQGMRTLRMDAIAKLKAGVTTLAEVTRVTADDEPELKQAAMDFQLEEQVRAEGG
jgi:type IV pilus assembly protein PilB